MERETGGVRPSRVGPASWTRICRSSATPWRSYPRLRATRILEMVRERGYAGSVFPVRRLVRRLRPESGRAVYHRVVTLVGEQAQVDWGSFGKVRIGQGTRAVSGFVMVLGYSRALAAAVHLRPDAGELSCGGTSTPSRRWEASPATSCTTTCAAPCSTACQRRPGPGKPTRLLLVDLHPIWTLPLQHEPEISSIYWTLWQVSNRYSTEHGSRGAVYEHDVTEQVLAAGAQCSMDGRGRCLDNVFIERLWRSLKYEAVYLHELVDGFEAERVIGTWMTFYSDVRPHSALGGRTPAEAYGEERAA